MVKYNKSFIFHSCKAYCKPNCLVRAFVFHVVTQESSYFHLRAPSPHPGLWLLQEGERMLEDFPGQLISSTRNPSTRTRHTSGPNCKGRGTFHCEYYKSVPYILPIVDRLQFNSDCGFYDYITEITSIN